MKNNFFTMRIDPAVKTRIKESADYLGISITEWIMQGVYDKMVRVAAYRNDPSIHPANCKCSDCLDSKLNKKAGAVLEEGLPEDVHPYDCDCDDCADAQRAKKEMTDDLNDDILAGIQR